MTLKQYDPLLCYNKRDLVILNVVVCGTRLAGPLPACSDALRLVNKVSCVPMVT